MKQQHAVGVEARMTTMQLSKRQKVIMGARNYRRGARAAASEYRRVRAYGSPLPNACWPQLLSAAGVMMTPFRPRIDGSYASINRNTSAYA